MRDRELASIRAELTRLYHKALVWSPSCPSPYAEQLVDDLVRAVHTVRFVEADLDDRVRKEHCPRRLMGEELPPHKPCDTGDFSRDDEQPATARLHCRCVRGGDGGHWVGDAGCTRSEGK